jgi:chemotaxis family two-component system response regulator Rcp1
MSSHDNEAQPVKILLVEDGQVQTILVKNALADFPQFHLLHVAKNGVEATEFLTQQVQCADGQLPDLILLDLNMPEKDGFEVLAELKSDSVLHTIPVIVFTTSDCQDDVDRAYDKGANTFITKPVTLTDLTHLLNRVADYWMETARLPTNPRSPGNGEPRVWRSAG